MENLERTTNELYAIVMNVKSVISGRWKIADRLISHAGLETMKFTF